MKFKFFSTFCNFDPNELLEANVNIEKGPFGVLFETLMKCSTQKFHQFHQN